ncbi:hypothetical protein P7C70_g9053, partial [Phenoliferia sp. Uapishka_3]
MDDNPWGAPSPSPAPLVLAPESEPTSPIITPSIPKLSPTESLPAFGWGDAPATTDDDAPSEESIDVSLDATPVDVVTTESDKSVAVQEDRKKEEETREPILEPEPSPAAQVDAEAPAPAVPPPSPDFALPPIPAASHSSEGPPMDDFDSPPPSNPPTPLASHPPSFPPQTTSTSFDTAFSDDDDFGSLGGDANDDDFGDFGDFDSTAPFSAPPPPPPPAPPIATASTAFRLDISNPTKDALAPILVPFWGRSHPGLGDCLSGEMERQVEGLGQVLVDDASRELFVSLSSLPQLRPLDWRRSKIRREHLIALGVPVNLDDSADTKPLAPLSLINSSPSSHLHSGPSSAPARSSSPLAFSNASSSRPSTPSGRRSAFTPPPLDRKRALELCEIAEDDLLLKGLKELEGLKDEIERVSREASGALTHALLMREKEVGDGETYHGMIQDLVTAAARMKTTTPSRAGASSPLGFGSRPNSSTSRWGRKVTGGTSAVK